MNTERLRELAQNATPGPWEARNRFGVAIVPGIIAASYIRYPVKDRATNGHEGETRHDLTALFVGEDNDAEFIAAANPQTILALLDELAALRRGQGRAPAPAQAGPSPAPLHETHPIPDSTKEENHA